MEKYIIWYQLITKAYWKKKMYWIQLFLGVFLVFIVSSYQIPDRDQPKVGMIFEQGEYSLRLKEWIFSEESSYNFYEYENYQQLYQDVLSGKLECGFIVQKQLDLKIKEGNLKNSISYLGNTFSVMGETIQEYIYSGLFKLYSDEILIRSEESVYGDHEKERIQSLIKQNHYYQTSDDIFRMDIETFHLERNEEEYNHNLPRVKPIRGMGGLLLFFLMFMSASNKFDVSYAKIYRSLGKKDSFLFSILHPLAAGTVPFILNLFLLIEMRHNINIVTEVIKLFIFFMISSIWIAITGVFMKDIIRFSGIIIPVLVLHLLLCPIIINFERYFPAVRYLKLCFPLGIYLY